MLKKTKLSLENIWKIVKKIRLSFLSEHPDSKCSFNLLTDKGVQDIIYRVAKELELNATSLPSEKITNEVLQTGAEMFTYLNFCPSFIPKHVLSFAYLLKTKTPKELILALTSIIKTQENAYEKEVAIENFINVMETLDLKNYEKIQILTKNKCFTNSTFGKCGKEMNLEDKETLLGFYLYKSDNFRLLIIVKLLAMALTNLVLSLVNLAKPSLGQPSY